MAWLKRVQQADRLILCNYRIKPDLVNALLPEGVKAREHNGRAFGGIAIKSFTSPKNDFLAQIMGFPYELISHHFAIEWQHGDERKTGLLIFALHASSRVATFLSRNLYPMPCKYAHFTADEQFTAYNFDIEVEKHCVSLKAGLEPEFDKKSFFLNAKDAGNFFQESLISQHYINKKSGPVFQSINETKWTYQALRVSEFRSDFFEQKFASKDLEFDHAIMMSKVEPNWVGSLKSKTKIFDSSYAMNQRTKAPSQTLSP